jgi:hypothetical protein
MEHVKQPDDRTVVLLSLRFHISNKETILARRVKFGTKLVDRHV